MRRKICLVTPEFPPMAFGGLARTVSRVAAHLAGLGLDVHVLCFHQADGEPPLLDANRRSADVGGLTLHEVTLGKEDFTARGRGLWDCPHTLTLQNLFESLDVLNRNERFDAFVSFFLYPGSYVTGLLARREGLAHLACLVGNDVNKYFFSPEKAAVCRMALEGADRLVFLAKDLLELACALAPVRDKSRVIFNSVAPGPARWPGPRPDGPFTLGAAGIFKHAKGLPYLLTALDRLRGGGAVRLLLAGQARPEEAGILENMLNRLDLRGLVALEGVVPHADMPGWLAGLDAFVLPSLSEGCPNVLMEAMAAGLPCLATRVGAVPELIEDGRSGLIVDPGDSAALAAALDRLRRDPGLTASLGREAVRRMQAFSPERERREWEAVMREILSW